MSIIRQAAMEDLYAIATISKGLGYVGIASNDIESNLSELLISPRDKVWVCENEHQIVGWIHAFVSVRVASSPFIEIGGMGVDDKHKRKGFGSMLVAQVFEWAEEKNAKLRVRCNTDRVETHKFYKNVGFDELKTQLIFQKNL